MYLMAPFVPVRLGMTFFSACFFVLAPGQEIGEPVVEQLLWNTGASVLTMKLLAVPVFLLFNVIMWTGVAEAVRRARRLFIPPVSAP